MTETEPAPLTRRGIPLDPNLRVLALGSFANRFGGGAVMTTSALYFTRQVGLSPAEVAFALSTAGIVGLLVQVPAGHLGDTRGPTRMLTFAMVGSAAFAALPVLARGPVLLAVLLSVLAFFERSAGAIQQGVIAQLARGGRAVLFRAYLRAVTNTAIALGSLLGGLALAVDETWAYVTVFCVNAAFTGFAAWNTTRLPQLPAQPHIPGEPRLAVLRDWPYVVIVTITGLFSLHFVIMELGIALYISERTDAPTVMVAVLLILNTTLVALFQVRMSRSSDSVAAGSRALFRGGCFIAAGFVMIAVADGAGMWVAIAVLVTGSLTHVVGEMIGSGGQWELQMGLAPHERQGQYQGFAGLGFGVMNVLGPPVVAFFCVDQGGRGWLMLAVLIVGVSALAMPAARWALASRERYGVTTHSG